MTLVEHRPELIEEIAARLSLRDPNRRALDAVADALAKATEPGLEVVCDLATATGKSYIAGGLVEYLVASGIKNIAVVCHRTAILAKTRRNFTPGDPKYIKGLACRPAVVTADEYNPQAVRQALGAGEPQLFIFNVQQLLLPTAETRRRLRSENEELGGSLYETLAALDDLVVIADEHHCYYGPAFSKAVRELSPLALVGLTATPHPKTPPESICFHYPLAEAIADGFVKLPVLVGRRDGNDDIRRLLGDAVRLLDLKQRALDTWHAGGGELVRAMMFLVCQTVEEADGFARVLAEPGYLGAAEQILTVHSKAPDEALDALERVESADSPVRAVVSVQMLQEGWDVKNIYVVVTSRALESAALTEQVLGRGLRLPFGTRTGRQMLDTVEVLAHSRFRELLDRAAVLLEAMLRDREQVERIELEPVPSPIGVADTSEAGRVDALIPTRRTAEAGEPAFAMQVTDVTSRLAAVSDEVEHLTQEMGIREGTERFRFPRLVGRLRPQAFSLTDIDDRDVERLGARFATEIDARLLREVLEVERRQHGDRRELHVAPRLAEDSVEATQLALGVDELRSRMRRRILDSMLVERTRHESNALDRLIRSFLRGAGVLDEGDDVPWGEVRVVAAVNAFLDFIRSRHRTRPSTTEFEVTIELYPRLGVSLPSDVHHRTSRFVPRRNYDGWTKSVLPVMSFDAKTTEWEIAHLLDADSEIKYWTRIENYQEVRIEYGGHSDYYPDFLVRTTRGINWVVEGKSNRAAQDSDVLEKKSSAERWARFVNDSGDAPDEWQYLFVTEADIRAAAGSWTALVRLGRSRP